MWWQVVPRPLGDRLEYVGKEDYGSWLPLSSARPASNYYYATDMSTEEVREYFRGARVVKDSIQMGDSLLLSFKNTSSQKEFLIQYYEESQNIKKDRSLHTLKKYIVEVGSEYYDSAKASL